MANDMSFDIIKINQDIVVDYMVFLIVNRPRTSQDFGKRAKLQFYKVQGLNLR